MLALTLPPLRERDDDVVLLARHYVERFARKYGRPVKDLARDAVATLKAGRWIGDVRELAHVIERAMLMSDAEAIEASHAAGEPQGSNGASATRLDEVERGLIRRVRSLRGLLIGSASGACADFWRGGTPPVRPALHLGEHPGITGLAIMEMRVLAYT